MCGKKVGAGGGLHEIMFDGLVVLQVLVLTCVIWNFLECIEVQNREGFFIFWKGFRFWTIICVGMCTWLLEIVIIVLWVGVVSEWRLTLASLVVVHRWKRASTGGFRAWSGWLCWSSMSLSSHIQKFVVLNSVPPYWILVVGKLLGLVLRMVFLRFLLDVGIPSSIQVPIGWDLCWVWTSRCAQSHGLSSAPSTSLSKWGKAPWRRCPLGLWWWSRSCHTCVSRRKHWHAIGRAQIWGSWLIILRGEHCGCD